MSESRLRVNPIACDGRGVCAEVAPELIRLDDWGFPVIRPGPVPSALYPAAEAAVRLCPLLALALDHERPDRAAAYRGAAAGSTRRSSS